MHVAARSNPLNAAVLHQSRNSLRANANALVAQVHVNSGSTVRLVTRDVKSDDVCMQSFVCDRSSTLRTTTPFVESSCRDSQYVTQASHAMLRSLLLDECVFHRGSFAKNAAAGSTDQRNIASSVSAGVRYDKVFRGLPFSLCAMAVRSRCVN